MTDAPTSNQPHPLLQAALGTLDMTIESEMSLFRQYQTLSTLPDVEDKADDDPCLLPHASPEFSEAEQMASPQPPLEKDTEEAQRPIAPNLELTDDMAENLTPSELALFQVETEAAPVPDSLEQQEAVLESPVVEQHPAVAGAPLPIQEVGKDPHVSSLDPAIEDYLDSSTALRQHLEESVTDSEPEPKANSLGPQKLLMLLGLSIVGTFVIVLFLNGTGLRQKLWPPKRPPSQPIKPAASPEKVDPSPPSSDQADASPTPSSSIVAAQGPDLSTREFSDVNLGNLSRLQPSVSPTPSTSTSPALPSPTPTPSVAPTQESIPVLKNPTSQTGLFYVMLPYTNTASLTQAQKLVPTAFLTTGPAGQQVQVGALATMAAAQRLAKQLRSQGLSATIVAPNS